jgi:hypothetical protein
MNDPNRVPFWGGSIVGWRDNPEFPRISLDAHCKARRAAGSQRLVAHDSRETAVPVCQPRAARLYESSQPAPAHHPLLWAVVVALAIGGALAWVVRQLREPLGAVTFALIVAVVALMAIGGH